MKKNRHKTILEIIKNNDVETQEELAAFLRGAGFEVAQATVSRDIRKLNLTKAAAENGKQKYILLSENQENMEDLSRRTMLEAIVSTSSATNIVVIKTRPGMGMAVAVNIDTLNPPEVLGTIAGDDVVFCAVKAQQDSVALEAYLNKLLHKN